MAKIKAGQQAPQFELSDAKGKLQTLAELLGDWTVIFFYPKDMTPTCTVEACEFSAAVGDFKKLKAAVIGISPDDSASHSKFIKAHGLKMTLLADVPGPRGTPPVCKAYGVWGTKSMYGKTYKGVIRTTFLLDREGVIRNRWEVTRVKGHVEEVIAAIREAQLSG
jgi:peroxiredoxin Q/BCP